MEMSYSLFPWPRDKTRHSSPCPSGSTGREDGLVIFFFKQYNSVVVVFVYLPLCVTPAEFVVRGQREYLIRSTGQCQESIAS